MNHNAYNGQDLIDGIKAVRDSSEHDTVYCNFEQYGSIELYLKNNGPNLNTVDQLRVAGLDIHPLKALPDDGRAIVCQKGDIFPLAKEYKNGTK